MCIRDSHYTGMGKYGDQTLKGNNNIKLYESDVKMCIRDRYIEEGLECYPLAEGLQDAYALILINEALKSPGRPVRSETQIWAGI